MAEQWNHGGSGPSIYVLDTSNPGEINIAGGGTYRQDTRCNGLYVRNGYTFFWGSLDQGHSGLHIFPTSPFRFGIPAATYTFPGVPDTAVLAGNGDTLYFIGPGDTVTMVDIWDPQHPAVLGTSVVPGCALAGGWAIGDDLAVYYDGGIMFLSTGTVTIPPLSGGP